MRLGILAIGHSPAFMGAVFALSAPVVLVALNRREDELEHQVMAQALKKGLVGELPIHFDPPLTEDMLREATEFLGREQQRKQMEQDRRTLLEVASTCCPKAMKEPPAKQRSEEPWRRGRPLR